MRRPHRSRHLAVVLLTALTLGLVTTLGACSSGTPRAEGGAPAPTTRPAQRTRITSTTRSVIVDPAPSGPTLAAAAVRGSGTLPPAVRSSTDPALLVDQADVDLWASGFAADPQLTAWIRQSGSAAVQRHRVTVASVVSVGCQTYRGADLHLFQRTLSWSLAPDGPEPEACDSPITTVALAPVRPDQLPGDVVMGDRQVGRPSRR